MLDKFRRTGPASLSLGILLSFDFLQAHWRHCPLGALLGTWKSQVLHVVPAQGPHPGLKCAQVCTHIALTLSPRLTLGLLLPHRGP